MKKREGAELRSRKAAMGPLKGSSQVVAGLDVDAHWHGHLHGSDLHRDALLHHAVIVEIHLHIVEHALHGLGPRKPRRHARST
eukprot:7587919-Pyramimonas_sp.AAC.1